MQQIDRSTPTEGQGLAQIWHEQPRLSPSSQSEAACPPRASRFSPGLSPTEPGQADAPSQVSFGLFTFPVDTPPEACEAKLSTEATPSEDASHPGLHHCGPVTMHVKKVPMKSPPLTACESNVLQQYEQIWKAVSCEAQSQADTASSESRHGSPIIQPSKPNGKQPRALSAVVDRPLPLAEYQRISLKEALLAKPVAISLRSAISNQENSQLVPQKGASLTRLLCPQSDARAPHTTGPANKRPLSDAQVQQLGSKLVQTFKLNLGKPRKKAPTVVVTQSGNAPSPQSNLFLGQPAFANLGFTQFSLGAPMRAKAFSLQVHDPYLGLVAPKTEEKMSRTETIHTGFKGSDAQRSPRITLPSVRSLLLDSDDDDFDELIQCVCQPRTLETQGNLERYLNICDEEGQCHPQHGLLWRAPDEPQAALGSQSIFRGDTL